MGEETETEKPETVTLYEVDIAWVHRDRKGSRSVYVRSEGAARQVAKGSRSVYVRSEGAARQVAKDPVGYIPADAVAERATVYRCAIENLSPRAMLFGVLNRTATPTRLALVYGDIPLPLAPPDRTQPSLL